MTPTEKYFPVVLIIMLYKLVLTFKFLSEFLNSFKIKLLSSSVFPAKLCVMLYKVVLNVDSVGQDTLQKVLLTVVLTTLK